MITTTPTMMMMMMKGKTTLSLGYKGLEMVTCGNEKLGHKSGGVFLQTFDPAMVPHTRVPRNTKAMWQWHAPLVSCTHGRSNWPHALSKSGQSCNLTHTSKPISWQPAVEPAAASSPDLISATFHRYHSVFWAHLRTRRGTSRLQGRPDRDSVANRKRRLGCGREKKVPFNKILISGL